MAQNHRENAERDRIPWTLPTNAADVGANQPSRRMLANVRSSPIAIVRTSETQCDNDSSSEDEDNDVASGVQNLNITSDDRFSSRSLPNHLLRAPRLGSRPLDMNDDSLDRHPTMLPPAAAALSDNNSIRPRSSRDTPSLLGGRNDHQVSYGSLRESHMNEKFLDGPRSYRDRATGHIHSLQQRVRFDDNTIISSSMPPTLSIGERIMATRKKQTKQTASNGASSGGKGALAALMEGTTPEPDAQVEEEPSASNNLTDRTPTFYDHEESQQLPDYMLSTSLTGFEVLQAGLRTDPPPRSESNVVRPLAVLHSSYDELPRDSRGNNSLLARSSSDPLPDGRPRAENPLQNMRLSNPAQPPPLSLNLSMIPNAAPVARSAQLSLRGPAMETSLSLPSDHNPDTDLTFDMELE